MAYLGGSDSSSQIIGGGVGAELQTSEGLKDTPGSVSGMLKPVDRNPWDS